MTKTRTIAEHEITLIEGERYVASRPMAARGRTEYPVLIVRHADPFGKAEVVIPGLTYDQANALLAEFNNGPLSFDGRVW